MKIKPICRVCGAELNDENWYPSNQKKSYYICKSCYNEKVKQWRDANPDKAKIMWTRRNRKHGFQPFYKKKDCPQYLGVYVAEQVLSHVFKNVQRMPFGNPGFDFKCRYGYLVDVKSACREKVRNRWQFHINHNATADYFLCLAFDNREDLNPMHIWLIPGEKINHLKAASISQSTIRKWREYEQPIDRVITCCNMMKQNPDQ